MTAEIVVVNKSAVALAADSKVTVGRGQKQKTYDTVNKLFTLSKFEPVGIMIYGNSEFMGFPWETLIKDYRNRTLKNRSFVKLQHYANDFFKYLSGRVDAKKDDWSAIVFLLVADKFIKLSASEDSEEQCDEEIERLDKRDTILKTSKRRTPPVLRSYSVEVNSAIEICFEEEEISNTFRSKLRKLARLSIIKDDFSSYMSGVVFAGFGSGEMFPTVVDFSLEGIISGVLKKTENRVFDATRDGGGFIKPFAQHDMVYRFMEGVDRKYQRFLEGLFFQQINDALNKAIDRYYTGTEANKEKEKRKTVRSSIGLIKDIRKKSNEYRSTKFVKPIISMLDSLPKEELANMADALVSLTALKRKVSEDFESVGGAIDVAVISKGDGFVWIKRKHYFEPKLNQSFMLKYLRT